MCKDNTKTLLSQLEHQKKTICDLTNENEILKTENEELLLKMVRLQAKTSSDKRALERLANHMLLYCEVDCGCTGEEAQPGEAKAMDNKAK